ncbi:unnamed protein product [Peronospora belbahrii]|uniref:Reverse transcriptase RNase H-like domain-containing protein n=1 Tax=Peronospora belbahrii TaxID=622444 RepID=A0ABN8CM60_9STRA|nr:unnamed protein product [Peronospora belbahrii]
MRKEARPLSVFLKKDVEWCCNTENHEAFEAIKESLLALLQVDSEGRKRVISFESRQLKAAEKNYPVYNKELLAMKYALVQFRRHRRLISRREWLVGSPFFAEYNVEAKYKRGKQNVLSDALSSRPDFLLAHLTVVSSSVTDRIRVTYAYDEACVAIMQALGRA